MLHLPQHFTAFSRHLAINHSKKPAFHSKQTLEVHLVRMSRVALAKIAILGGFALQNSPQDFILHKKVFIFTTDTQ